MSHSNGGKFCYILQIYILLLFLLLLVGEVRHGKNSSSVLQVSHYKDLPPVSWKGVILFL